MLMNENGGALVTDCPASNDPTPMALFHIAVSRSVDPSALSFHLLSSSSLSSILSVYLRLPGSAPDTEFGSTDTAPRTGRSTRCGR